MPNNKSFAELTAENAVRKMPQPRNPNQANDPWSEKDEPSTKKSAVRTRSMSNPSEITPPREPPPSRELPKGSKQTISSQIQQHTQAHTQPEDREHTIIILENKVIREATRKNAYDKENNAEMSRIQEEEETMSSHLKKKRQQTPGASSTDTDLQLNSVTFLINFPNSMYKF